MSDHLNLSSATLHSAIIAKNTTAQESERAEDSPPSIAAPQDGTESVPHIPDSTEEPRAAVFDPQQRLHFLDLPEDILMSVMATLRPFDVRTLRSTCKLLDAVSRRRWIWMKIIQNNPPLQDENPLLASPMTSATSSDLEKLAMTSSLLAHLARPRDASKSCLRPRKIMTVPVLDPIRAFPLIYCNEGSMPEVFLVPGGHYVLVNLRSEHEVMLFRLDATDSTKLATLILEDLPYYVGDIKVVEGGDIGFSSSSRCETRIPDLMTLLAWPLERISLSWVKDAV
ncbi:hypothetical protein EV714DRAFT_198755 [Schizophyllum commune]